MAGSNRNTQVEGLRGFAILCVVFYHLFVRFFDLFDKHIDAYPSLFDHLGAFGVEVFMVISAFYLYTAHDRVKLKDFYLKKFFRLWPLYFVAIIYIFVLRLLFPLPDRPVSPFDFFTNIFFINQFIGLPAIDGAHWYLGTLIGVIFIYGLIQRFSLQNKWWILLGWLLINSIPTWVHINYIGIIQIITGGAYVGTVVLAQNIHAVIDRWKEMLTVERIGRIGTSVIALVYSFIHRGGVGIVTTLMGIGLFTLCFFYKLKLFDLPFFQFFSRIEYSLYLTHQFPGYILEYHLMQVLAIGAYRNIVVSCISSAFVLIVACVFTDLVEPPIKRLSTRCLDRLVKGKRSA